MHRSVTYSLATFTDCLDSEGRKILSFTIRTTDGTDETYSAKRAETTGNTLTEELIRFSITKYVVVDGVESSREIVVKQPFLDFDRWATKSRNFVVAAWKRLSTPNEVEIADFFASATETE